MKKLLLIVAIILNGMTLNAQKTFFPTKEGTVLIYKTFDKKDKITNTVKYTIEKVNIKEGDMDITYLCESIDPKDKLVFKEEITNHLKGNILYLDMSNYINKAVFQQNGEIPADVQVTGNNIEIPLNLKPGDVLSDASIEMSFKMGFINLKVSADVTNRKVEMIEDVTVQAGTFKGYKLTSDVNSLALGIKMKGKNIEWYAKGIGSVKTETFDDKGKLESHTELVELK